MRRIALINEKGGSAKSTTAVNLAVGLARRGRRTLIIDLDPQANTSLVLLGGAPPDPPTIGAVVLEEAEAADAIRPTAVEGLDILPADASLAEANLALANLIGRERRLGVALVDVERDYDFILIDTSPQRSLLTVNALTYVSEVEIPIEPSLFGLAGLGQIQSAIDDVRRFLGNPELRIAGLILTRVRRDTVCRDVERQLRESFGELVHRATVPQAVKVEEAHSRFQAVLDYAPGTPGAVAYAALVEEIEHGGTQGGTRGDSGGVDAADDPDRDAGTGRTGRRRRAG